MNTEPNKLMSLSDAVARFVPTGANRMADGLEAAIDCLVNAWDGCLGEIAALATGEATCKT